MIQARAPRAISPVVGVILLVAVTVVLSAGVGLFVLDQQPPDSANTGTGVTNLAQALCAIDAPEGHPCAP